MITVSNLKISDLASQDYSGDLDAQEKNIYDSVTQRAVFGTDLYMFGTTDLRYTHVGQITKSDLDLSVGILNYTQAVHHRISTVRGSLPEDSSIGIPWYNYLGKTYYSKEIIISELSYDIETELYRDERTGEVLSVDIKFASQNVLEIVAHILPISGTPFSLSATITNN